jgi:O-acetyl-ADP-ribose deacetylase (regulator of RNase III)
MIIFTQGNLLDADVDALVNTVNTVGIMGKGIALMFKEAFPENYKAYEMACKRGEVRVGKMFVTRRGQMIGPKWIVNFPTKQDWRANSKIEWIEEGLSDLRRLIVELEIRSIALPPLGSGNGGLAWADVRSRVEDALRGLEDVSIVVYEPTAKYQNVAKRKGVEKLTPARALVAELVRRYSLLGIDCTLLEIQKLAYFLERHLERFDVGNPLDLQFRANKFGPYAPKLNHLLDGLDGSYLHCDKRLADASPYDVIWFDDSKKSKVAAFLAAPDVRQFRPALEATEKLIDGFQSPLGMELLATVDWLIHREKCEATVEKLADGLSRWPGGSTAAQRKKKLFDNRLLQLALGRLAPSSSQPDTMYS